MANTFANVLNRRGPAWMVTALLVVFCGLLSYYLSATQYLVEHETIARTFRGFYESNGFIFYALEDWLRHYSYDSPLWLRSVSMISSLLALVCVYRLGYLWHGHRGGLCSAFVMGVNLSFLSMAAHARFYALNYFFVALSTLALYEAFHNAKAFWWCIYALALSLSVLSMTMSLAILLPHAFLVAVLSDRNRMAWLRWTLAVLLAVAVFGVLVWLDPQGYTRVDYGAERVQSAWQGLLCNGSCEWQMPAMYRADLSGSLDDEGKLWQVWSAWLLVAVTLGAWIWSGVSGFSWQSQRGENKRRVNRAMCALWLGCVAVLLALALYSWKIKIIVSNENLSWFMPLAALVLGAVLASACWWRWVYCLALLLAPFYFNWVTFPGCDTHDRYFNAAPIGPADIVICMRYRPNAPYQRLTYLGGPDPHQFHADLHDVPLKGKPLFCNSAELLGGYLRQLGDGRIPEGQHVWLFYPWVSDEHLEELYAGHVLRYYEGRPGWWVLRSRYTWGKVVAIRVGR